MSWRSHQVWPLKIPAAVYPRKSTLDSRDGEARSLSGLARKTHGYAAQHDLTVAAEYQATLETSVSKFSKNDDSLASSSADRFGSRPRRGPKAIQFVIDSAEGSSSAAKPMVFDRRRGPDEPSPPCSLPDTSQGFFRHLLLPETLQGSQRSDVNGSGGAPAASVRYGFTST